MLDPKMTAKEGNQVLMLLHNHSTAWATATDLLTWVEYSNGSAFRRSVLTPLHKDRLIEFDSKQDRARLSPLGAKVVELKLLKRPGP